MRKILYGLWVLITAPFRLIGWIFRPLTSFIEKIIYFFTFEPEEHPLGDVLAETIKNPSLLLEQIGSLRDHLLRALLVLAAAIIFSFIFTPQLIDFLAQPIGGMVALKAIDVTEPIGVFMRVALLAGFTLASPYITFEIWLFSAPGMKARTRRLSFFGGIPLAFLFFIGGLVFTYKVMLPTALPFLLNFMGIETIPRPSSYIGFVTGLMFWIGIAFEFPLVIYALTAIGLVQPQALIKQWRLAVVIIAVLAAAITPTVDPVNMGLIMIPMILLYLISILFSLLARAGKKETLSAAQE